jgi:hypothetical protein
MSDLKLTHRQDASRNLPGFQKRLKQCSNLFSMPLVDKGVSTGLVGWILFRLAMYGQCEFENTLLFGKERRSDASHSHGNYKWEHETNLLVCIGMCLSLDQFHGGPLTTSKGQPPLQLALCRLDVLQFLISEKVAAPTRRGRFGLLCRCGPSLTITQDGVPPRRVCLTKTTLKARQDPGTPTRSERHPGSP